MWDADADDGSDRDEVILFKSLPSVIDQVFLNRHLGKHLLVCSTQVCRVDVSD